MAQTLDNLYQAFDAKDAIIMRLLARLRELGQEPAGRAHRLPLNWCNRSVHRRAGGGGHRLQD